MKRMRFGEISNFPKARELSGRAGDSSLLSLTPELMHMRCMAKRTCLLIQTTEKNAT